MIEKVEQYSTEALRTLVLQTQESELGRGENFEIGKLLVNIQRNISLKEVDKGKCMFQYRDPQLVAKMLIAVLAQFNAQLNVSTERMNAVALYEAALMLGDYTHERVEDVIMCLKMVKEGKFGKIYNRIDLPVLMGWWKEYLEYKFKEKELDYKSHKGEDTRNEMDTLLRQQEINRESMSQKLARQEAANRKLVRQMRINEVINANQ
jgi:hypothetical protein